MNIALIQPPIFWTTTAPLGPAYLAGELRTAGETATLIDFNIELLRRDPAAYVQVQGLTERFAHDSPLRTLAVAEIEPALSRTCATDWRTLDGLVDEWVSRILRTAPDLVGLSIHEESLLPALLIAYRLRQRAGRDGLPADCVLLYQPEDKRIQSFFLGGRYPTPEQTRAVAEALVHVTGGKVATADTGLPWSLPLRYVDKYQRRGRYQTPVGSAKHGARPEQQRRIGSEDGASPAGASVEPTGQDAGYRVFTTAHDRVVNAAALASRGLSMTSERAPVRVPNCMPP